MSDTPERLQILGVVDDTPGLIWAAGSAFDHQMPDGWTEYIRADIADKKIASLLQKLVERSRYISTLHPNVCICHHCTMTREQTDELV